MRDFGVLLCAGLAFCMVATSSGRANYVSTLDFDGSLYLGSVPDGEGRYAHFYADFSLNWDIPSGIRPWYLGLGLTGELQGTDGTTVEALSVVVNESGIGWLYDGSPGFVDWSSLGVPYVPGLGIYLGDYDLSPLADLNPADWLGFYVETDGYIVLGAPGENGYDYYIEAGLYASHDLLDPYEVQWIQGDIHGRITLTTPGVPEPASSLMALLGLGAVSCARRKPARVS